jgi:hypothetical protein
VTGAGIDTHIRFIKRDELLKSRQRYGNLIQIGTRLSKTLWEIKPGGGEAPLRSELFSREQMKEHGKLLAASHSVARGRASDRLLSRLADNERVLNDTCHLLTTAIQAHRRIAPAGEWLLDNFYLIEQQIRTARRHLPKGYSQASHVAAECCFSSAESTWDLTQPRHLSRT